MIEEFLNDPMYLYAVAFVIFLALAFAFARKPALGWLDAEIAKIRAELDQASKLRAEAEAALADCKNKQIAAEAEARQIVIHAQQQVEALRAQSERDLAVSLARHEQIAAERIRMAQADAVAEVRAAAVDLAMSLARKSLTENLSDLDAAKLIDQAIADLPALKPDTAKAA